MGMNSMSMEVRLDEVDEDLILDPFEIMIMIIIMMMMMMMLMKDLHSLVRMLKVEGWRWKSKYGVKGETEKVKTLK